MIQRLFVLLVLFIFEGFASYAYADDMTVFGLTLAQDFSLPECKKESYGYSIGGTYYVCFERLFGEEKQSGPIVAETVKIRFPIADSPSIVKGRELLVSVIDSKLEGLRFDTFGIQDADIVLGKLKEKYGEPKVFTPRTVKNRFGGSFEAFDASWSGPNLQVLFQSVRGSLDSGLVQIDTTKSSENRSRAIKELTKDKRPL